MGLTQKLGTIPLAIQTDSSNNVGIGGAANASYKLAVTGASLFSSNILANGVMSLGDDGTYGATYKTLGLTGNTDGTHRILAGTSDDMYIAAATSRGIKFCVNGSITTRAIITSSGNVGIGTSTPNATLDVTTADGKIAGFNSSNANGGYMTWATSGTTIADIGTAAQIFGSGGNDTFGINARSTRNLVFGTANIERFRITSGGFLKASNNGTYIGVTGAYHEFRNTNTNATDNVAIVTVLGSTSNNASNYHYIAVTNSADKLYIYGNGNVVNINGSYGTLSDISLKENIIDSTPKLDDLLKLKVRNFNLIDDENKTKQIGFIAQEFEEVFPAMIDTDGKSGMKTIKTSVLVPMLVKAIQELNAKVTALENK